ncbi:hypothetical protein [Micromonospora rubida]|uniref:hypothetical protein n=1 Tax=Micromonospora rubida TaxID=2697657 RepID=UPI001378C359|nr:hypothetical protein [Micromonospora rubida]NBE83314.1 hypothetical protein [Micromonospora rubida]
MHVGDAADRPEPGFTRPGQVPLIASRVEWREMPHPDRTANRYDVIGTLLAAGIDAARIHMYYDHEDGGAYWVVTLDDGRAAVLTDDTEEYVGHLEGPWPFKAIFLSPDGVRTKIDYSVDKLKAAIVTWCAEAVGPR